MRTPRSYIWVGLMLAVSAHPALAAAEDPPEPADPYREQRERLVRETIERTGIGAPAVRDEKVLKAMRTVPRHEFVPETQRDNAYQDRPLPIGYGQTISQPYIVALMTDLLKVGEEDTVLEIGAGSGYQAAVLAEIVKQVYTIEIIEPLGNRAKERFDRLGYKNVETRIGDGYYGWEAHAPFDAIIVTAAASHIPPPLVEQLRPGGRMVIPVGPPLMTQQLMIVEKAEDGSIMQRNVLPVRFVPLTRGRGQASP